MRLSGYICRPVFLSLDFWSCTVELLPCLRGCKLEPSLKDSLSWSCSLFSAQIFKKYIWRSIRLNLQPQPTKCYFSSAESRDNSFSTHHLTKAKRSKLPLLFGYTFRRLPARSSLWKPSPSVSINSTNFWRWKDTIFPIIYFIKYYRDGFGKIWIRKFIYICRTLGSRELLRLISPCRMGNFKWTRENLVT